MTVEQAIRTLDRPIFTTREITSVRRGSLSGTSQALGRMQRQGLIRRAVRGVWCNPEDSRFTRFGLVPFLSGSSRAYVSVISALSLHGVIDQIPQVVYVVTTGQTRLVNTSVGRFSFHRIQPGFFDGFDWNNEKRVFLLATPEKALVDALYLSSRKGRRFRFLPELDVSADLDAKTIGQWIDRIGDSAIRASVLKRVAELGLTV